LALVHEESPEHPLPHPIVLFPHAPPHGEPRQLASASPPANTRAIKPKINNLLFFMEKPPYIVTLQKRQRRWLWVTFFITRI
jgi:hypothetical protein